MIRIACVLMLAFAGQCFADNPCQQAPLGAVEINGTAVKGYFVEVFFSNAMPSTVFLVDENGNAFQFDASSRELTTYKPLSELGMEIRSPAWSPDGGRIAFTSNDDLYVFDVSSENLTRLTQTGTAGPSNILWKSENELFYKEEVSPRRDVVKLLNIDTSAARAVFEADGPIYLNDYVADAGRIFLSQRTFEDLPFSKFLVGQVDERGDIHEVRSYMADKWVSEGMQDALSGGRTVVFGGMNSLKERELAINVADVESGCVLRTISIDADNTEFFAVSPDEKLLAFFRSRPSVPGRAMRQHQLFIAPLVEQKERN